MSKLIPLHIHTEFSLLDGAIKVGDLVKYAVENELPAIAITDHGVVQSFPEANHAVEDNKLDIKVIYGVEAYVIEEHNKHIMNPSSTELENAIYVSFDLETTGLFFTQHEIIEIGAVKIENGKITETFSTLIKPEGKISEEITKITGITNEMVKDAPSFQNVLGDFYKFCEGCVLVGYNILEFDIKFLNYHANKFGVDFDHKIEDALILARKFCLGLKRYKLKDVCNHLEIVLENAHRALFDTIATAEVFIKLSNYL